MSNKKNPLNYRVTCKECHIGAKLRRFPACQKDCGTWKFVQEQREKAENDPKGAMVQIATHKQQEALAPKINEHTLTFVDLKKDLQKTISEKQQFVNIQDVDMR